jgi:hypothetical protein
MRRRWEKGREHPFYQVRLGDRLTLSMCIPKLGQPLPSTNVNWPGAGVPWRARCTCPSTVNFMVSGIHCPNRPKPVPQWSLPGVGLSHTDREQSESRAELTPGCIPHTQHPAPGQP